MEFLEFLAMLRTHGPYPFLYCKLSWHSHPPALVRTMDAWDPDYQDLESMSELLSGRAPDLHQPEDQRSLEVEWAIIPTLWFGTEKAQPLNLCEFIKHKAKLGTFDLMGLFWLKNNWEHLKGEEWSVNELISTCVLVASSSCVYTVPAFGT